MRTKDSGMLTIMAVNYNQNPLVLFEFFAIAWRDPIIFIMLLNIRCWRNTRGIGAVTFFP
jgi:hypothetical protein